MPPSLATKIAGISLKSAVYNASGPRSGNSAALAKVANSKAGAVLSKSATVLSQTGNPQPRIYHAPNGQASQNSEGLPNSGIDYYISEECIFETFEGCPTADDKPYIVSISGKNLQDNLTMIDRIIDALSQGRKISSVELNLACPNVIGKPIISYDMEQMNDILEAVRAKTQRGPKPLNVPLGIKLAPILDQKQLSDFANLINSYKDTVRYVVAINTIGNSLAVDVESESPPISSNNGYAGLSGQAVKYTAMANVRQLRTHLDSSIDVVGVGGIASGEDAFAMFLCGANAVQVGTCHWTEGPKCFDRIIEELQQIMTSKGYSSLDDVIGKLKPWSKEGAALSRAAAKKMKANAPINQQQSGGGGQSNSTVMTVVGQPISIIDCVLVVIIAVLMAEKFGLMKL
mmetsp:Transcript_53613/g.130588  ORF Transcript_53613/g.130588 Transcript_53613/m.130588 type:complete len:402 (-) Transcript_53613:1581-2786(-)